MGLPSTLPPKNHVPMQLNWNRKQEKESEDVLVFFELMKQLIYKWKVSCEVVAGVEQTVILHT